jgi:PKD domain
VAAGGCLGLAQLAHANQPPEAGFILEPVSPHVGELVTFASTTRDPDGDVTSLEWDFGDGSARAQGEVVAHSYATPGPRFVTLTATDATGARSVKVRTITVAEGVPPTFELMRPFPIVRLAGRVRGNGARVTLLGVRNAPRGARVEVRCVSRRCPYRRASKLVRRRRARFKQMERSFPAGTLIAIRVTREETIGKYTRFRIRRGRVPARKDRCLIPHIEKPQLCRGD